LHTFSIDFGEELEGALAIPQKDPAKCGTRKV
jgi:hypothetical protein